jgi:hypothetical protein
MAIHTYQMSINYNADGQFATNVLHFTFDDAGFTTTSAAAVGLANGWDNANRTRLRNLLPSAVTILSYRGRALNVPGGFEGIFIPGGGVTGNRAGTFVAAGIGPVSILYGVGNSAKRGRIFWPGITNIDCVGGRITNTLKAVIATSLAGMISTFPTVGGGAVAVQPVIYSRSGPSSTNIGFAQMSPMVGQQRRRQVPA